MYTLHVNEVTHLCGIIVLLKIEKNEIGFIINWCAVFSFQESINEIG